MIKAAVIGVGYLGQYHAEKIAQSQQAELIAVCDTDSDRADTIAARHNTIAITDYTQLLNKVDAACIVTPTPLHFEVAKTCLEHGIHTLIEKPITTTLAEAEELIELAKQNNALLQVGHLERFNNAVKALESQVQSPRFIESTRLAPFKLRGSDVNVILDLMIHDIDLIHSIVKANIIDIRATGAAVLSEYIDIANARIAFDNGCVANVTASRASLRTERKLRIFEHDNHITVDLNHKSITQTHKCSTEMFPGIPNITRKKDRYAKGDALADQIESFFGAISGKNPIAVTGEDGKNALKTAIQITQLIKQHNTDYPLPQEADTRVTE